MTALGPNDLQPCGTETARRRHVALAEACGECGTPGRSEPLPSLAELVDQRRVLVGVLRGEVA